MDWDRLRIFHAVVEAGSFTKAGRALDLSQSAISRQIGALEETLGVALFHRHTRGVVSTEQGDDFHATVREMAAKIEMARPHQRTPRILRVSGRAPSFTTHRGGAGFSARSGVQGGRRIETRCRRLAVRK